MPNGFTVFSSCFTLWSFLHKTTWKNKKEQKQWRDKNVNMKIVQFSIHWFNIFSWNPLRVFFSSNPRTQTHLFCTETISICHGGGAPSAKMVSRLCKKSRSKSLQCGENLELWYGHLPYASSFNYKLIFKWHCLVWRFERIIIFKHLPKFKWYLSWKYKGNFI